LIQAVAPGAEPQLRQFLANPAASSPASMAAALGVAFFLGAAHALTPGHGKTIVAAYLVGSRGRVVDAVYLGAAVTATHTASVFVLGLATLFAARQFDPNVVSKYLALASGLMVAAIGLWLLIQRSRAAGGEDDGYGYSHSHDHAQSRPHSHGAGSGSLLSLGISGGLVPCPEALIVLIFAASIQRIAFGLALLTAFSAGLAAVLIAIGVAMVHAGPAMRRVTGDAPWVQHLPVVSALVVTTLGIAMLVQTAHAW